MLLGSDHHHSVVVRTLGKLLTSVSMSSLVKHTEQGLAQGSVCYDHTTDVSSVLRKKCHAPMKTYSQGALN